MPDAVALKTVDFNVFSQFVWGSLNPLSKPDKTFRSSLQLVRFANTHVVCSSQSKEEANKTVNSFDLTSYGYHSTSDYELNYEFSSESNSHSAIIRPLKVYPLREDIQLPIAPDKRTKMYLDFFSDEFERVKIRAVKILASAPSERFIHLYASRNLQIARKLFHDASILLRSLYFDPTKENNSPDFYIIYTLNLFVIRGIVFFSKFFKPYLSDQPASEEKLRSELHNELPTMYKHPWLFDQRPALYQTLNSCLSSSVLNEVIAPYTKNQPQPANTENIVLPDDVQLLQQLKGKFKLNCNTNIFADVFFQMLNEKKENEKPCLDADSTELIKVLTYFFSDKTGQPLSPHTLRSMLKPSNFTKRPFQDDENRIKLK